MLARIAALNEWWARSQSDFASAIRLCRREGLRPYLAIALYERAKMYAARGGARTAARSSLRESRQLFSELGMRGHLERTEALESQLQI